MKARHCIGATLPALYERPPSGINTGCLRNGHSPHCFIATLEIGSSYVRLTAMPFPKIQVLSRLAGPAMTPLGGASNDAAWRAQCLRRLAGPVFTPLGGASICAAWRAQCLRRLAGPVFAPLGGPSVYPAWVPGRSCYPHCQIRPAISPPLPSRRAMSSNVVSRRLSLGSSGWRRCQTGKGQLHMFSVSSKP